MFFRLYRGNVNDLMKNREHLHSCFKPDYVTPVPSWTPRFMRQVPEALDFLNSQGIIHRDIKAANILYDLEHHAQGDRENFYVADFGLSVAAREAKSSKLGTGFYGK